MASHQPRVERRSRPQPFTNGSRLRTFEDLFRARPYLFSLSEDTTQSCSSSANQPAEPRNRPPGLGSPVNETDRGNKCSQMASVSKLQSAQVDLGLQRATASPRWHSPSKRQKFVHHYPGPMQGPPNSSSAEQRASNDQPQNQETDANPRRPSELRVRVENVPMSYTTSDLQEFFSPYGHVHQIDIDTHTPPASAIVVFRPCPPNSDWLEQTNGMVHGRDLRKELHILPCRMIPSQPAARTQSSSTSANVKFSLPLRRVAFGVMQDKQTMLSLNEILDDTAHLMLDIRSKALDLVFCRMDPNQQRSMTDPQFREFTFRMNLAQVAHAELTRSDQAPTTLRITLAHPPMVFKKLPTDKVLRESGKTSWQERHVSYRQTDIDIGRTGGSSAVRLHKADCDIDVGRWLTYQFMLQDGDASTAMLQKICQALLDCNVALHLDPKECSTVIASPDALHACWTWLDETNEAKVEKSDSHSFHDLRHMETTRLHFNVRYQLEVCLSTGILHEANITRSFLARLAEREPSRAVKLLEKAASDKKRFFNPDDIFHLETKVSFAHKKPPEYCTKILAATVTPTTIYFSSPVLDTSNRIIRKYKHFEDRFMRVRFSDELYRGKIMSRDDDQWKEVFSRIKRVMDHGIRVGDRLYEFLAYGNSQFREHGAYFFASNSVLNAADIRRSMGNFDHIRVIAKYASRLGQCFSTTRSIPLKVELRELPDVERNGFCFTDGVGTISPFLAQMIVHHYNLPGPPSSYSVFQFRLEGLKGVLAIDPTLKGRTIGKRPSQSKFTAPLGGLEICRISGFGGANLNVQIILVLSALGVSDVVFVRKVRAMLSDIQEAMTEENKASELLLKNVDCNQHTLTMAQMIADGFMRAKEPFFISCLRLWRSWSLKYLKEKARIFIEKGAFVLGCTDETGTLKGHFDKDYVRRSHLEDKDISILPEIFLQIPDSGVPGRYKIIEGVCTLNRNPSLHPGDVRVVRAVDVPGLRHLKNCVVLPQTGDRDLANMCSGGDLDGDDYLIMWDPDLLPKEWNHPPMDYTAPKPVVSAEPVTVDQMTTFFIDHIKTDNLARIAVAHRYWADRLPLGVKDPRCRELARLHSKAVDYAKTGVPAEMPAHLRVQLWPHWAGTHNKSKDCIYRSKAVIGQVYDEVERQPFTAAWDSPFDARILTSCTPSPQHLADAAEVKILYDDAVRRIMTQYGIASEFEVITGFTLSHHWDFSDYKIAEKLGEAMAAVRSLHREICFERAGTDATMRDWDKLMPFVVAMYSVTANEVAAARGVAAAAAEGDATGDSSSRAWREGMSDTTMPFMSFPWLFQRELGIIAAGQPNPMAENLSLAGPSSVPFKKVTPSSKEQPDLLGDVSEMEPAPEFMHELPIALEAAASDGAVGDLIELDTVPNAASPVSTRTALLAPSALQMTKALGDVSSQTSQILEYAIDRSASMNSPVQVTAHRDGDLDELDMDDKKGINSNERNGDHSGANKRRTDSSVVMESTTNITLVEDEEVLPREESLFDDEEEEMDSTDPSSPSELDLASDQGAYGVGQDHRSETAAGGRDGEIRSLEDNMASGGDGSNSRNGRFEDRAETQSSAFDLLAKLTI